MSGYQIYYETDYKNRLTTLGILPLMYLFELYDILFLVRCFKFPDPSFPLMDHIHFIDSSTRCSSFFKLAHKRSKSFLSHQSYFFRIVHTWNTLPPIDLNSSYSTIKLQLKQLFWSLILIHLSPVHFI